MSDLTYLKRTIVKQNFFSESLGEIRSIRIFLPPGYLEWLSYKIIYCQDGEEFFNFGRIATQATQLINDGECEPFIIIAVDVDKNKRSKEYTPDGSLFDKYVTFFAEELVPWVESTYVLRDSDNNRIIAGDSLGATVSLHIAIKYRHLFQNVISLSGAYYPVSQNLVAEVNDLAWLNVFMLIGLQETAFETDRGVFNFVELNHQMHHLLNEKGAQITFVEKDGQHLWGFWQKELPAAIRHFLN